MAEFEMVEREGVGLRAVGRKTAGRRPSVPVSPEAMDRAVADLMRKPWIEVATYATLFGVGLPTAYKDAQEGRFGSFRVGVQYRIPTPPVREALGLPTAANASPVAA